MYLLHSWCIQVQPGTISWRGAAADHSILLVRPGHLPEQGIIAQPGTCLGTAHPKRDILAQPAGFNFRPAERHWTQRSMSDADFAIFEALEASDTSPFLFDVLQDALRPMSNCSSTVQLRWLLAEFTTNKLLQHHL
jgi:hypothetical protein